MTKDVIHNGQGRVARSLEVEGTRLSQHSVVQPSSSGSQSELVNRRSLLTASAAGALGLTLWPRSGAARLLTAQATPAAELIDELVIDLTSEPASLDPATTYEVNGWSIVHSVYDSLVQYGPAGEIEPILAESVTQPDPLTWEIKLRPGRTFHNGEAFDAESVAFSLAHIVDEKTASSIAGNFATISEVKIVDPLTVVLTTSVPSPWLPAQISAWLACVPAAYAAANDFSQSPVGTGPYRFVEWVSGERIVLEANPDYPTDSPKGRPVAQRVVFRFVSEPATRVADLLAGTADVVRGVPVDQIAAVEDGGATVIVNPISATAFIRIPTDVAPFDDVRVRQALNYAVDVESIVEALLGGYGKRLANFFVEGGLGFDPALPAYSYDPDKARALLAEAGLADGFQTRIAYSATERGDLVEAIAGMLAEVGIEVTTEQVEVATFNQQWKDPEAAPLRYVTWRPMFDPYTLLSLIVSNQGFLSRHDNPAIQALIETAATESDPAARASAYVELGKQLNAEPAGIYLWGMTAFYGQATDAPAWTPRADDYIIATAR